MSLGLMAIMLNEVAYVDRWVAAVQAVPGTFDQVVVVDGGSTDGTADRLRDLGMPVVVRSFAGHFADQRNFGIQQCTTDWIFEVDADEIPSRPLLAGLRAISDDAERSKVDCCGIPRINLIDGVIGPGPGDRGLDYQYRLHHRCGCQWRGAVHEEITGYRARVELRIEDGHFLLHDKTSARHVERNEYYWTLSP